jgi:hypothetical protein
LRAGQAEAHTETDSQADGETDGKAHPQAHREADDHPGADRRPPDADPDVGRIA